MNNVKKISNDLVKIKKEGVHSYKSKMKNKKTNSWVDFNIAYAPSEEVYQLLEDNFGVNFSIIDMTPLETLVQDDGNGRKNVIIKIRFVYFVNDAQYKNNEESQRVIEIISSGEIASKKGGMSSALSAAYTSALKTLERFFNLHKAVFEKNTEHKKELEEKLGDESADVSADTESEVLF